MRASGTARDAVALPLEDLAASPADLAVGLLAGRRQEFLHWLVEFLAGALDVHTVFVGELHGEAWDQVMTLAAYRSGEHVENFVYELRGTPCEQVVGQSPVFHARDVAVRFPDDLLLAELGAESYVGVPLQDASGRPLGLIATLDRRPRDDGEQVSRVLERFRDRVAANLESRRALQELQVIHETISAPSSSDTFRAVVRSLARAMHVKVALVAERLPQPGGRVRTLAVCRDGEIGENYEYDLAGSPCAQIYVDGVVVVPSDVAEAFPDFAMLQELGAEAFAGIALEDTDGERIGHVSILHDRPLHANIHEHSLFRVLAARAGAELMRVRAEEKRRTVERNLLEAQKMESLGLLAGGIAHDFNNLLVGILGTASLALKESPEHSPLRTFLHEIQTSAERAAELARQMLAYSGKGHFVVTTLDLNELVSEMGHLLQVSIAKKIVLRFDFDRSIPGVVADPTQLRQVVMNLVLNAAEAIGERSGVIAIATGLVRASRAELDEAILGRNRPEGEYVCLEVADTGTGMDAETLVQIFDPFFTTKFTGRGLGLAVVHGIVNGHEGALWVESEPGRGTKFRLFLSPAQEPTAVAEEPPDEESEWRGEGLVLVVDDEETVRVAAGRLLESIGFDVLAAEDGERAVELFRKCPGDFRAVLLDMTMPRLDGQEAFRAMRAVRGDVRVLLMSGYTEKEATRRFSGQGLAGFLQKPFTVNDMRQAMRAVTG